MHIDRLEKAGKFPKRVRVGANAVAWIEEEIDGWQKAKADARSPALDPSI
jgi:prophage regulatory protein